MNPVIPDKVYFKIGEVAEIIGVEPYVLRYWESEFPQIKPVRASSKQRLYRRQDLETLLDIKRLLYVEQFTIAGARKRIASKNAPKPKISQEEQQEFFLSIKEALMELRQLME